MAEAKRPKPSKIRIKEIKDPLPDATFGSIGCYVEVAGPDGSGERFDPRRVVLHFDARQAEHVDLWTLMLFEVDPESRSFTPIDSSRVNPDKHELEAWLDHPGTYGLIGLPKHPALLETLRLLDRFGPQLTEERDLGEHGLQDRICGLILCDDPTRWGGGPLGPGDLCAKCLGLDVSFPQLPERFLFEREIPLRRFPPQVADEPPPPPSPVLLSWGRNSTGTLGDGTKIDRSTPVLVAKVNPKKLVGGSSGMTIALDTDGTVWSWGRNDFGQLGDGRFGDRSTPGAVAFLTNIVDIAASEWQAFAVRSDGSVWKWGADDPVWGPMSRLPVQVSGISDVVAIAAGTDFALALKNDGRVWSWGDNGNGQLGDGTTLGHVNPALVPGLTAVRAVAAGPESSFAIKVNGDVVAWGGGANGNLGVGDRLIKKSPVPVPGVHNVDQIAAGFHTLARTTAGDLFAWGHGGDGEAGDGGTSDHLTPLQVPGLSGITGVAAGDSHCVALKSNGTVWAWGWDFAGQVGDGGSADRLTPFPVPLPGVRKAVGVGAGENWSFAILG